MKYFAIIAIIQFLFSCGNNSNTSAYNQQDSVAAITDSVSESISKEKSESPTWGYSSDEDKMTNKKIYFAKAYASTPLNLDFPYEGSQMSILLRNMDGKNEVILQITKGQFLSKYDYVVKIKIDSLTAKSYGFADAADHSTEYIFLNKPNEIIKGLKKGKKMYVEAPIYRAGKQVMEFDISGLKWDY